MSYGLKMDRYVHPTVLSSPNCLQKKKVLFANKHVFHLSCGKATLGTIWWLITLCGGQLIVPCEYDEQS